jgi:23S rRNA (uracil1939-C5)-methyltransferase
MSASEVGARIERLVAGGEGLAFVEGRALFVPFALPGELVRVELVEERRDFARGRLLEVLEASEERVEPACPLYGTCGGCNLQHLSYEGQVRAKAAIVRDVFRRTARHDPGEVEVVASAPWGYRNRLQLHFGTRGGLGFARRESQEVIEAAGCPVAAPVLQAWLEERAGSAKAREEFGAALEGRDRFVVFGSGSRVWVEGRHRRVTVEVGGEEIGFDLRGFFQSNLSALELILPEAMGCFASGGLVGGLKGGLQGPDGARAGGPGPRPKVEKNGVAADLYAGVGFFGHFLSRRFSKVIMVEENAHALAEARLNAPGPAHEYYRLSVEAWCRGPGARVALDALLVDPPRGGLSAELRAWIARRLPPVIAYVSCDPVTLARDSGELLAAGYRLDLLKVFDFYPQTGHIESLARFSLAAGEGA